LTRKPSAPTRTLTRSAGGLVTDTSATTTSKLCPGRDDLAASVRLIAAPPLSIKDLEEMVLVEIMYAIKTVSFFATASYKLSTREMLHTTS
jgi:hypothetical protein